MKKRIFAVLMTLLCVSLVFALASCGGGETDEQTECTEHTFGEWKTEVFGTCGQETVKVRECSVCGFEEEDVIVEDHQWTEWEVVTELTCTQHGLKTRTCTKCDWFEKDEKEAQGHVWGTEPSKTIQEGDCTTDGIYEYKCENCDETKEETVKAEDHTWSEWGTDLVGDPFIKEATCEEAGYIGRECTVCGEQEYEDTEKLPHEWNDWVVVGSCAEGATRTRTCANCDEEEEETTAPGEHANIIYEGAKAPTLEEDGSTGVKKCLACGETLAPAKTIRYSNIAKEATVSTNATCWITLQGLGALVDGNREIGTGASYNEGNFNYVFAYSADKFVNKLVIVVNGKGSTRNDYANVPEVTNHDFKVTVSMTNKAGEVVFQQAYQTKDLTELVIEPEADVCEITINVKCDWKTERVIWEVEVFATSILSACDVAGAHTWGDWGTVNAPVCNNDGTLVNGLEKRTCSVCGDVEENVIVASHTFGEWDESQIACLTGGTKTRECSVCGYVESQTVTAGGHVETEIQGAKEPTFEEDGSTGAVVCTKCGATVEEAKVISKYVNVALGGKVTTDSTFWASTESNIQKLIDGNRETGVCSSSANREINDTITLAEASKLKQVILVVNGKGSTTEGKNYTETTNRNYTISFVLYDESGNKVFESQQYQTADLTEIVVDIDLPEGKTVKSMTIKRHVWAYENNNYLWEVEMIAGGEVVENKAE